MSNWVLFGMITGVLLYLLYPSRAKGGFLGALLLAIIGAVIGGFLGS